MLNKYLLLLLVSSALWAQKSIDFSGRVSVNTLNTVYDESSPIKPDSVADETYGKTTLIPGLSQFVNLALFARTSTLDISLLGDIRNNSWNRLDFSNQNTIDRLSLAVRYGEHELVLGDFYQTGSDFFIQSREIRGGRLNLNFGRLWSSRSFLKTTLLGGISERKLAVGARSIGLYKQFESSGIYRRTLGAASMRIGETGRFDIGLHFLMARDDSSSISAKENEDGQSSLNDAIFNRNAGLDFNAFFWKKRLKFFGEGFYSLKDTLGQGSNRDLTYKSGLDFRYSLYKLVAFYYRIGQEYYTAGYPFLLNDRQGFKVDNAYSIPRFGILGLDVEQYRNNLNKKTETPTTRTRLADLTLTTDIKRWPEITVVYGYRDDLSDSVFDVENNETKTNKISRKYELRLSQSVGFNRFSASGIYLDLDDYSKVAGSAPLGTRQLIGSVNFYTRPANNFFVSGGLVYSELSLTDGKKNKNYFLYESHRWDIIPMRLIFEGNVSAIKNDASGGGTEDMLSNYWQLSGQLSLEYFFVPSFSIKFIGGTNRRNMAYTTAEALQVLTDPDIDPTYFNGNESYNALIYGVEFNWMF